MVGIRRVLQAYGYKPYKQFEYYDAKMDRVHTSKKKQIKNGASYFLIADIAMYI